MPRPQGPQRDGSPSPQGGTAGGATQASAERADLDRVSAGRMRPARTPASAPRAGAGDSPFDAQTALETLLERLRASSGATRVGLWVHEATTDSVVPFRSAVATTGEPPVDHARLRGPVALSQS